MRKIKSLLLSLVAVLGLAVGSVGIVSAAPAVPSQCTGTYTTTVESDRDAGYVQGTAGDDFIVVTHDRTYVVAGGGNDCILITSTGEANYVLGQNGNDTIVDQGVRNSLNGDAGNDRIDSVVNARASLNGGAGVDTCNSDYYTSSERNCEL
jgi:Ca2+-binding RTX toxin-like protein